MKTGCVPFFGMILLLSAVRCWGGAKEPIELRLSCARTYTVGEPIILLVEAQNVSEHPQEIDDLSGGWANMYVMNFEISGPKSSKNRRYTAGAGTDHHIASGKPLILNPNETSMGEFDLTKESVTVEIGQYTVVASYRVIVENDRIRFVKSNPVSFNLLEPNEEDKIVIDFLKWEHSAHGLNMDAKDDYFYNQMGFESKYLSVLKDYPESTFVKYVAFYLARYYSIKGRAKEAIPILKNLLENQPEFALTDDAMLLLSQNYLAEPGELDKAQMILEQIVSKFPKGNCARDAKLKMEEIKSKKKKE